MSYPSTPSWPLLRLGSLMAAVVIVLWMAACGGDEDGASSSESVGSTDAPAEARPEGGSGVSPSKAQREATSKAGTPSQSDASQEAADPPAPGFRDTSGVTDVPAFGEEADEGLRGGAEATLNAYLEASREGDFTRACSYLLGEVRGEITSYAKNSEREPGAGCAEGLSLIPELLSGDPYYGTARVASLRFDPPGAFALFHGTDGIDYWMAMRLENGEWHIISTTPQSLQPR